MSLLNFEYQFLKYGEFHSNPVNQAIHVIFVPTIIWTSLVWVSHIGFLEAPYLLGIFPLTLNLLFMVVYAIYFIALWPLIGLMITPVLLGLSYMATQFANATSLPFGLDPVTAATLLHLFSWVVQIIGHQVFEKRAPAFLKDPIQAFVLAILFVFLETLFAFGFFPELQKDLTKKIDDRVKKYRASLEIQQAKKEE